MIREVDLVSYLPPFIAEYEETNITLTAENPEFILVWKAADRVMKNEFISTADEYGISRFEKMLNILPARNDTLENRRAIVQSRWFIRLPYTWRMLLQKLIVICGNNDFKVSHRKGTGYEITFCIFIEPHTEPLLKEIEQMLENFLPANMFYQVTGNIIRIKANRFFVGITRSIHIKTKAVPEPMSHSLSRTAALKVGVGIMKHVKVVYLPERIQK